jgi:hypothetical protein
MRRLIFLTFLLTSFLLFSISLKSSEEASILYTDLYESYYNWTENFYGGDKYYYREINSLLFRNIGNSISTPGILMKITLEQTGFETKGEFILSSWVHFRILYSEEEVVDFYSSLSQVERIKGVLMKIGGTIDSYKVDKSAKKIVITLKSVQISRLE